MAGNWSESYASSAIRIDRLAPPAPVNDGTAEWINNRALEFKWKAGKSERGSRVFLKFKGVSDVATVRVNGIPCGTAWTAPYEVEVTSALKKGKNTLEIEVVRMTLQADVSHFGVTQFANKVTIDHGTGTNSSPNRVVNQRVDPLVKQR